MYLALQILAPLLGMAFLLAVVFWFLVLPILLIGRTRQLDRRLTDLEARLAVALPEVSIAPAKSLTVETSTDRAAAPPRAETAEIPQEGPRPAGSPATRFNFETWIGARGLGWLAVLLLLVAAALFLKYAFDNDWIGPTGQVAFGLLAGSGLAFAGMRVHQRGRPLFGQMLTAAGVVLLYLSAFATFGFYRLVPQEWGFVFLVILVVQSAALAVVYEARGVALMAVVGGLLTPLLLHSETDQYATLFVYLLVLNVGVVVVTLLRSWPILCSVALLGSQGIFIGWAAGNFHPEKLGWALGFQGGLFVLFQGQLLLARVWRGRRVGVEGLVRVLLLASLCGGSLFGLLWTDYRDWMGTLAIGLAILYTATAWWVMTREPDDPPLLLTLVATAMGFLAFAIPLQARSAWIPVGWAVQGLGLWWFGLRIRNLPLRAMGCVLLIAAVVRLAVIDTPFTGRELFVPFFNSYAMPALMVTACVLTAAELSRRFLGLGRGVNRVAQVGFGLLGILLLWFVLSNELYDFFYLWAGSDPSLYHPDLDGPLHRGQFTHVLLAQTVLSAVWAVYALAVVAVGLRLRSTPVRWTGMGLFALTFGKVFFYDTAELDGLYRVAVFLVLSLMTAAAAWGYQKLLQPSARLQKEGACHDTN